MALITMQRDLVVSLKKETLLNVGILNKLKPMPEDLPRQVFKENALEKPTQNLFNHISHYLVGVIDPPACASLSWPLYDSKTERAYRNELANFISDYSSKGMLSPVMTSYLVNPGCYKVTMLIFQMSQLAVQKVLVSKMKKGSQKKLYNDITEQYKTQEKEGFLDQIEKETDTMLSKFSTYLLKRKAMETIAEVFCKKISKMEAKLVSTNAQKYIDDLVDGFVSKYPLDDTTKAEIILIKKVSKPAKFFESWLIETDRKIDEIESKWSEKVTPFIQTCKDTKFCTESLIARHTGEAEKNSYMIEYNHKTDEICTSDLQNQVNSQQKYILRNIVKDERLNFPNLIRGFLIAICFILKNAEIGDEIYKFNEYLEGGKRNYCEIVKALRKLVERVMNAEARLEPSPVIHHHTISMKELIEIPPLPDLSDLRCSRELQYQAIFDSFTPLSMSKHQFNLQRRTTLHTFVKPQPKSLLVTPFYQGPRDEFMKGVISCHTTTYDHLNTTQNFHNLSMISKPNRANETIAECSSGFTKQQILRLLSTKKSSSKKFKHKTDRPTINIKKGGLFNESNSSNESSGLFRSYSSPNLYEIRDERVIPKSRGRKLSIMQEDSLPLLEVSGIAALDKDSSCDTSKGNQESSRKSIHNVPIPNIAISPVLDEKFQKIIKDFKVDLNKEFSVEDIQEIPSKEIETKTETPKTNSQLKRKASSLEKIISRFRKIQANVTRDDYAQPAEFRTIAEERENMNVNIDFTAKRVLLPDLLSPSCSVVCKKSTNYLDQICMDVEEKVCRKPRESLGTALGVDQTFLDQFDLID